MHMIRGRSGNLIGIDEESDAIIKHIQILSNYQYLYDMQTYIRWIALAGG